MAGSGFAVGLNAINEFPPHLNDLSLIIPASPLLLPFGRGVGQDDGAAAGAQHLGQRVQGAVEGGECVAAAAHQMRDLFESLHGPVERFRASRFCHSVNLPRQKVLLSVCVPNGIHVVRVEVKRRGRFSRVGLCCICAAIVPRSVQVK